MAAKDFQARFVAPGERVDYNPVGAILAGVVSVVGGLCAVNHLAIPAGGPGAINLDKGVYEVVKVTGDISQWDAVYWDADANPVGGTAGTGALTTTSSGNTFFGFAIAAALSGDQTVYVFKIPATTVTVTGVLAHAISDPGNAGAIPVSSSGYVPLVTGAADTRTLAVPTFIGQELLLYVKTDGGTVVITVASAINQTGNNTITMADVRDSIRLQAIESGSNLVWDVVANNGAALSTV